MSDDRQLVTIRLSTTAMKQVRQLAHDTSTPDHRTTASDVIRLALQHGLPAAAAELRSRPN